MVNKTETVLAPLLKGLRTCVPPLTTVVVLPPLTLTLMVAALEADVGITDRPLLVKAIPPVYEVVPEVKVGDSVTEEETGIHSAITVSPSKAP